MAAAWTARGVCLASMSATAALGAAAAVAQEPAPPPAAAVWNPPSIYPDLAAAPARDVANADWLWRRSKRAAKRRFPTVAAARGRGYRGRVRNVERPRPFFFHLKKPTNYHDGRELDPKHPEAVVYWYDPPRPMVLVGFMFRVREGHEPRFARSVLPWHSHCDGWSVVMHTWFTDDLRSGVARRPPRPELATALNRDFGDPTPDSAAGCQPPEHMAPADR
jgi:hypothetical protein